MNDPGIRQMLVAQHTQHLERRARRWRPSWTRVDRDAGAEANVGVRLCTVHDNPALERLAQLEGRPLPGGRFVVAEVGGEIVAALALSDGAVFGDPFRKTAHLVPLMRARTRRLDVRSRGRLAVRRWRAA
jgi:hypothetical protein